MKRIALLLIPALMLAGCGEIEIKGDELELSLGQSQKLEVSGAESSELTFTSDAPHIASVDGDGTVTANGDGIAVITARAGDKYDNIGVVVGTGVAQYVDMNGNIVSSLSAVPVDASELTNESDITALSLSLVGGGSEDVTINTERDYEIKITKTPTDSVDKVILRISDPTVARVEGNILKGVARGKTTLTATAPNGVSAEMIVRVK